MYAKPPPNQIMLHDCRYFAPRNTNFGKILDPQIPGGRHNKIPNKNSDLMLLKMGFLLCFEADLC